ncbi:MAG TPA: hypothetical protein VJ123_11085, partial [Anaerolineales bacterium]|nr:hypothetical protein [Anaerolineales bacterium]
TASAPNRDVGASPNKDVGARYFDTTGHTLDAGFVSLFQELGGETVVGAPIAEAEAYDDQVIQYFENVGMVRNMGAASSEARLLPLGAAALKEFAGHTVEGFRILPGREIVLRPFQLFVVPLGGEAIFGRPLSEPYLTQDGAIEQVYERAILYSPENAPGESYLRPLGAQLGPPDATVGPSVDSDSIYFSSTGHNVRWAFAYFFLNHGEERILGRPLEEAKLDGAFLSQRFENVVLRYDFTLPSHLAVQLEPLGRDAYVQRASAGAQPIPPDPDLASTPPPAANVWVTVQAWAEHPSLPSFVPQRIIVRVSRPDGTPWIGARPIVAVTTAARGTFFPLVQPTDVQGSSVLVLELADLLPGEIVNFEVAIAGEEGIGYAFGQFAAPLDAP